MRRAREEFHQLVSTASPKDLRRRSNGTRWTNRQLLLHMVFGYIIVRTLLPLVHTLGRSRGFVRHPERRPPPLPPDQLPGLLRRRPGSHHPRHGQPVRPHPRRHPTPTRRRNGAAVLETTRALWRRGRRPLRGFRLAIVHDRMDLVPGVMRLRLPGLPTPDGGGVPRSRDGGCEPTDRGGTRLGTAVQRYA
jgi:hypothetical protein